MKRKFEFALGLTHFIVYSGIFIATDLEQYLLCLISLAFVPLIINLFWSKRWYFRVIAIMFNANLLLVFFLPKTLKNGIEKLKASESAYLQV